jgi:ubiquinone/menaquinone biosynthesis C-methylase UbiE
LFYETLARHYDEVFPKASATVTFLDKTFKVAQAEKILDLACGTGTYTLELARLGYQCWGTDLEPGMIEQAKAKAKVVGVDVRFEVGDMREPESLGLTFDGLFCIGNSLAHLLNLDDLKKALTMMCSVLSQQGVAVFQVVNYDRILAQGDTELPLIERDQLRFTRMYRPQSEERLIFDSFLEVRNEDGSITKLDNSVELRPLRKTALETYLLAAGFSTVKTYGDFKGGPYTPDSQATILVARR